MTRGATTRRVAFLPFRFDPSGLSIHPTSCVLDGRDVTGGYDIERHLWDISAYRFNRARLNFEVEVPRSVLESVLPEAEQKKPIATLMVVTRCAATRLRGAHIITTGELVAGRYSTTIELSHADVVGSAMLVPYLLRASDRNVQDQFATARGSRLASGRPIEIRFETLRSPSGEYLDVRYESFKSKGPPQFPQVDALYKLECEGEAPILWLNSDHQRVCAILDDAANVGRMARMRDVVFDQISQAVWMRLFLRATRDVANAGETVFEWQDAVLGRLLPHVYPNIADQESRIAALVEDVRDGNEHDVVDRLDGALQEWLEVGKHATALAEEIA